MKKTLSITGNGIALERFAREQRLRFKKEGFSVTIGVTPAPAIDTKAAPVEDVKTAPAEEKKPETAVADTKAAPAEDKKTTKKSNKK